MSHGKLSHNVSPEVMKKKRLKRVSITKILESIDDIPQEIRTTKSCYFAYWLVTIGWFSLVYGETSNS